MLHKVLSGAADVDMHHEYMVHITQPLAVRRYLGLVDDAQCRRIIEQTHLAAIRHTPAKYWGDSSNKLSWLIPDLAAALPQAKFVHLVRDGRKVASSYFHKLGDECYDDRSNAALQAHYDGAGPAPPPEKKYWWPVPRKSDPNALRFRRFDQFERIAWHWAEINRVALAELAKLPLTQTLFVKLEELTSNPSQLRGLYEFLGLPYRDADFAQFARPHNVNKPEDRLLTARQSAQFQVLAGDMMARLGYDGSAEYVVNY